MSQQNVQAVRGLYEAFNRGDLDAFEKGCARKFIWNEADNSLYSGGNPYRSFAEVRDSVFAPTARDFENFRVDLEQLLDAGDYVIGTGRYHGKYKATGKTAKAQFCHVIHVDSFGKLDGLQEYADTLEEAEVAGRVKIVEEMRIPQPAM
ncbi:MAG TPA: nuclear transport factor 2 family protein [Sphingomicrobium sp.]